MKHPTLRRQGQRGLTIPLKNARKMTTGSQRWVRRHINDPYVQKARTEGFRSRAAFKLIQLDDKYHFLKRGKGVIDLGAAPGGWTQIAVKRVGADTPGGGWVLGIDLLEMDPLPGATLIQGDFLDPQTRASFNTLLKNPADVVLSDMASSTIGHGMTDHLRTSALAEAAFAFAKEVLAPGGVFISKVFQGGTHQVLLSDLKNHFSQVKHVKPLASRKESPEMYVLAFGFRRGACPTSSNISLM